MHNIYFVIIIIYIMSKKGAVIHKRLVQFTYLNEVKSNVDSWYMICTNGRDSTCIHKADEDHILWYGPRIEVRASLFYNGVKGMCLYCSSIASSSMTPRFVFWDQSPFHRMHIWNPSRTRLCGCLRVDSKHM